VRINTNNLDLMSYILTLNCIFYINGTFWHKLEVKSVRLEVLSFTLIFKVKLIVSSKHDFMTYKLFENASYKHVCFTLFCVKITIATIYQKDYNYCEKKYLWLTWCWIKLEAAGPNGTKLGKKHLWKVLYEKCLFRFDPLTNMAVIGNSCFLLVDF
jgi:hypothetical protein